MHNKLRAVSTLGTPNTAAGYNAPCCKKWARVNLTKNQVPAKGIAGMTVSPLQEGHRG